MRLDANTERGHSLLHQGTSIALPLGERPVGRGAGCFMLPEDDILSRTHFILHVGDRVENEDFGRANGTYVNNAVLTETAVLKDGDRFPGCER